ncbi:hypothetical protein [Periweissella ghanensis]|uniref:Integrase n=1 Tax=Periweissella ghanensis TaxID=467997 RepID=A0ABM8Z8L0_9LACO|nr:hypothetical protein [Periweissella ghanensis]MCM0600811.1 hypothetical protein [Periweissella ghanensis]CAH0417773.1 hypothetical protein WGH24286_00186 [Periweissella ghanensis]
MLNYDLADLSHLVQDSQLTLETRMALVLLHHGLTVTELTSLTALPSLDWVPFEKPFIKIFKKAHPHAPFAEITAAELSTSLTPFLK